MVRTNQGGSVLSFIIIGVVMALLLVGGAYIIRQQVGDPQRPTPTPQQSNPQTPEKQQPAKPAPAPKPETTPAPSTLPQTPSVSSPAPAPSDSELPKTGPADTAGILIAILVLTAMTVAYAESRRQLRASSL